jgi:glycosyltransferase involved in cell wall biosynthesis
VHDIIAISPYIMREYAERTQARWHRIANPLPGASFDVQRAEEPGRLLYAGTITPLKDIMTLLRALVAVRKTIPAARLRLAGRTGDQAYERDLREFIAASGLEGCVDFLGLLSTADMLAEYARCSLVALPSRQEVLPMTVIEAMAVGAPVVATRAGGLADLVEDGMTGSLVDVGDSDAMAAAIVRLLQDARLRHRMGERGRQIADERFRAASVAARYREVYKMVAATGSSRKTGVQA